MKRSKEAPDAAGPRSGGTIARLGAAMAVALAVATAVEVSSPALRAQQQAPLVEPVFGVGDNEFLIGGWNLPMPRTAATLDDSVAAAIAWARNIGVTIFRLPFDYGWTPAKQFSVYDGLLDAADATSDIRFFLCGLAAADMASYGLEAKFHLVPDSVPFKDWPCRFRYLGGGVTHQNSVEHDDWGQLTRERRYHRDSVASNTTIADSIVIDASAERTGWWSQHLQAGNWCRVPVAAQQRLPGRIFGELWSGLDKGHDTWADTAFVVVTGHLDAGDDPVAHEDSTVLWIDVSYDIGRGETYFDPQAAQSVTATTNLSSACTTLAVRRRDLDRRSIDESWDRYQSVSLAFDATRCNAMMAGPLHASAGVSRRINLRVRYAGNATVALRSVALRDARGDSVLSDGPAGAAHRDAIEAQVLASATSGVPAVRRPSIIGLAADGEQSPVQSAAVYRVNKWLQGVFGQVQDPRNGNRSDTIGVWLEGLYREGVQHQLGIPDSLGRLTMVAPEFGSVQDKIAAWATWSAYGDVEGRGAIREHNGGRYMLPQLALDSNEIEDFERQVQVRHLCQYLPDAPPSFPFQTNVARVARVARDQRKRLVAIPFLSNNIWIRESRMGEPANSDDSIGCDRILEPAEIRNAANISLAMGARGVFWQVLSGKMDFMRLDVPTSVWHGRLNDYPMSGGFTEDTIQDAVVDLAITDADGTTRFTMPDTFWTGWRIRTNAIRQHNRWLARVGPELMKLAWRTTYSIHAQRPVRYRWIDRQGCEPSSLDAETTFADSTAPRVLPSNEIITEVTARSLSGRIDPDSATYVELGLFDMKPGRRYDKKAKEWISDPMLDEHSALVVNRRVFEPTDDIPSGPRRDTMVALAESRRIGLKLNLMNMGEFVFCRVREIAADTARLPGAGAPRTPLDTIVPADSVVVITLGPGRASLLRITYLQWDTNIVAGKLEFSNQRKLVFDPDQGRFHVTYMRPDDTSGAAASTRVRHEPRTGGAPRSGRARHADFAHRIWSIRVNGVTRCAG